MLVRGFTRQASQRCLSPGPYLASLDAGHPLALRRAGKTRSPRAVGQVLVADREDAVLLDLEVANDAGLPGLVGELDVVAARRNPGDAQPLIVIDAAVGIVRALIDAPGILSGGRELQVRHGRGGEIPETNAFALAVGRK